MCTKRPKPVHKYTWYTYFQVFQFFLMKGVPMDHTINTTPTHLKMTLTIKEAAEYSNIGINKIDSMLRTPNCPFVLFVGAKKLVKRVEFEEYIRQQTVI